MTFVSAMLLLRCCAENAAAAKSQHKAGGVGDRKSRGARGLGAAKKHGGGGKFTWGSILTNGKFHGAWTCRNQACTHCPAWCCADRASFRAHRRPCGEGARSQRPQLRLRRGEGGGHDPAGLAQSRGAVLQAGGEQQAGGGWAGGRVEAFNSHWTAPQGCSTVHA